MEDKHVMNLMTNFKTTEIIDGIDYSNNKFMLKVFNSVTSLTVDSLRYRRLFRIMAKIGGKTVRCLVDNGGTGSTLSKAWAEEQGLCLKKSKFTMESACGTKKPVEGEVGPLKLSLGENFNCSMGFYVVPHYRDWEVMLGVDFLEDTKSLIQFGRDTTYLILEDGTKIKSIESSISSLNRKDTELPKEKENYSYVIDQEEEEPTPDWEDEFEILKTKNVDKAHLGQVVLPDFPELTERFDNLFNEYIDLFATQLSDLEISSLEKFHIIIENTLPQNQ
jgi:hypothetical protein